MACHLCAWAVLKLGLLDELAADVKKELAKRLIGVLCDLALPIHPLSMIFYMAPRVFSKFINHPMVSLLLTYNFP